MTAPDQPSTLPPCADCGGGQVANLQVAGSYSVGLHPAGRTLWGHPMLGMYASVCLSCGRVTLFADDLPRLQESIQEHPDWYRW